ncbi:MAG: hypothetical protein HQK97_11675 [Nitrospirae bacterium]|nr:hypothetical protein [Nitrospirota bacterium]
MFALTVVAVPHGARGGHSKPLSFAALNVCDNSGACLLDKSADVPIVNYSDLTLICSGVSEFSLYHLLTISHEPADEINHPPNTAPVI